MNVGYNKRRYQDAPVAFPDDVNNPHLNRIFLEQCFLRIYITFQCRLLRYYASTTICDVFSRQALFESNRHGEHKTCVPRCYSVDNRHQCHTSIHPPMLVPRMMLLSLVSVFEFLPSCNIPHTTTKTTTTTERTKAASKVLSLAYDSRCSWR